MHFGISSHLYHDQRLSRAHLMEVADQGFESIELFATRSHFDYHAESAIDELARWLEDAGLRLHGVHAPIAESLGPGNRWGPGFSTATVDEPARQRAVREAAAALEIARRVQMSFCVVHLGVPAALRSGRGENDRRAALRSLEEIHRAAERVGVRVAIEVIPNDLSGPASLARILEDEVELPRAGICLDFGHALLLGDAVEAVEIVSEHLVTTHVHDNGGRTDDHLAPFDGVIDWSSALTSLRKVGYEGTLLLELANTATPREVLRKARRVRERFEQILGA